MSAPQRPPNIYYGGDKLAFVIPGAMKETAEARIVVAIIEAMRKEKRDWKANAEKQKEAKLVAYDKILKLFRDNKIDITKSTQGAVEKLRRWKLVEPVVKSSPLSTDDRKLAMELVLLSEDEITSRRKTILRDFDKDIGLNGGWSLLQLVDRIEAKSMKVDPRPNPSQPDATYSVVSDKLLVCKIYSGANKYKAATDHVTAETVYQARGTSKLPEPEKRRKQYVMDHHAIPTRRFVTRAISFYHLANMFGVRFDDKTERFWKDDIAKHPDRAGLPGLDQHIARQSWVPNDGKAPGQYPRADEHTLQSQSTHFNVRNTARVIPGTNRNTPQGDKVRLPSGQLAESRSGPATGDMDPDQRASMQVRDGSGKRQQMLSAAAVQAPLPGRDAKVIRGNKGERFDLGPETVAVVEIDLSVVLAEQITTLNQHSFASHEYKVAYDRYESETDKTVKRAALAELAEYVYSAQKNREVVLDRIPNSAITRIQISGTKKWGPKGPPFTPQQWVKWADAQGKLKAFIDDVERLTEMRNRAETKMTQRGSRT